MKIRLKNEFIPICIASVLLVTVINYFPDNSIRIFLGLPLVLYFPGYILTTIVRPKRNSLGSIERVALGFGLSVAIISLIMFILNLTPWGFYTMPLLYSLTIFIISSSIIAWYRRRRLPEEDRLDVSFNIRFPEWRGQSMATRVLVVFLIISIAGAIGTAAYTFVNPRAGESYTEFYILPPDGEELEYYSALPVGQETGVIVGIVNHENTAEEYRIEITLDNEPVEETGIILLKNEESWQQTISFIPDSPCEAKKLEFLLYRENDTEPYRRLYLIVDVIVVEVNQFKHTYTLSESPAVKCHL